MFRWAVDHNPCHGLFKYCDICCRLHVEWDLLICGCDSNCLFSNLLVLQWRPGGWGSCRSTSRLLFRNLRQKMTMRRSMWAVGELHSCSYKYTVCTGSWLNSRHGRENETCGSIQTATQFRFIFFHAVWTVQWECSRLEQNIIHFFFSRPGGLISITRFIHEATQCA